MLVDQTDDMEAVGDDDGLGEMPADQRTMRRGQIYADDAHQVLALQAVEVGLQSRFAAAQDDNIEE
jgi:hypothetical protein